MKKYILYSVLVMICFWYEDTSAQSDVKEYEIVSTYIHIPLIKNSKWREVTGFVLKSVDTSGNPGWQSEKISSIEKDSSGYFVKLNLPKSVLKNSKEAWCTAFVQRETTTGFDTISVKYGGLQLSKIKLLLKSTPEGAETFLIPTEFGCKKYKIQIGRKTSLKLKISG